MPDGPELELEKELAALHAASFGWAMACCRRDRAEASDVLQSADGAITLSPPRMNTNPYSGGGGGAANTSSPAAREPLGAIESKLFPPELVMEHQNELAIKPAQRDAILKEVERGQTEILKVQWEMQGEKEKLVKLLDETKVDEAKVSAAAARVMDRENKVKALHLGMLVRVKNVLDAEQQKKLRELRDPRPAPSTARDGGLEIDAGRP